jgi:membrane protein
MIRNRNLFPCYFGSALKVEGVEEFLKGLSEYTKATDNSSEEFGTKVYKITRDNQGNRLTHMKITSGTLKVKEMLKEIISNLNRQSSGIVASVSALTSLWSASNGLSAIQTGLEKLYGTQRPSLVGKPMALAFTLLYILLIPSLLIFQVLRSTLTDILKAILAKIGLVSFAGNIGGILRLSGIVVLALMILVIVLTYTYLPNGKRTVKSQLPGSVFSCILWTVFTFGFAFFIPRFWKASSFYGSLAAVFLSAMWLKFIITILFYGASLNKSCAELFGAEKTEDKA